MNSKLITGIALTIFCIIVLNIFAIGLFSKDSQTSIKPLINRIEDNSSITKYAPNTETSTQSTQTSQTTQTIQTSQSNPVRTRAS